MNLTLKWFFSDLQRWIDGGMRRHHTFDRHIAVCESLNRWVDHTQDPDESYKEMYEAKVTLRSELSELFIKEYCNVNYPFNMREGTNYSNVPGYDLECVRETLYQNPQRLAFIRRHAT